jgi:hypothetical protein
MRDRHEFADLRATPFGHLAGQLRALARLAAARRFEHEAARPFGIARVGARRAADQVGQRHGGRTARQQDVGQRERRARVALQHLTEERRLAAERRIEARRLDAERVGQRAEAHRVVARRMEQALADVERRIGVECTRPAAPGFTAVD